MKTAAISLVLLAVLFTGAVLHGQYVKNVADDLLTKETGFPVKTAERNAPDAGLAEAEKAWRDAERLLFATVNARNRLAVRTALVSLISYYENGSVSDYETARALFREALYNLKRADELGFGGLF